MSKTGEDFNPVRNERVKKVIKELGISQREFAKRIHMSEKTVSGMVKGRQKVTEETAQTIVEVFPDVCLLDWLLGLSNDQTVYDRNKRQYDEARKRSVLIEEAIDNLISLNGWGMTIKSSSSGEYVFDFKRTEDGSSFTLCYDELRHFREEIRDYVGFRLDQMEKRKRGR